MRLEVLTKDGLTYYHNKLKNTFVQQSNLNTAISNYIDTIDWVTEIGDAYVTPEQVEDIISQADLDDYMPLSGGTFTGTVNGVTPTSGDNSTKLATTAYVQGELSGATPTSIADTEIEQYWTGVIPEQVNLFLPLSGGAITGNLSVSGTITGNVTGTASGNLPLSGGTMTGNIIFGNNEAYIQKQNADIVHRNQLEIGWGRPETSDGGEWFLDGAKIALHSYNANNSSFDNGGFVISATDGTNHPQFTGYPDGRLTWVDKEIERIESSGTNYIRYVNGLQICWGHSANKTVNGSNSVSQVVTFPVAFKDSDYAVSFTSRYSGGSWTNNTLVINNNTTTSIELFLQNVTGSAYTFYFVWMAVGYWK